MLFFKIAQKVAKHLFLISFKLVQSGHTGPTTFDPIFSQFTNLVYETLWRSLRRREIHESFLDKSFKNGNFFATFKVWIIKMMMMAATASEAVKGRKDWYRVRLKVTRIR